MLKIGWVNPHASEHIWVLRYVLSNIKGSPASDKGIKQAENSMRRSILWRKDNAKLLKSIRAGEHPPLDEHVKKYISAEELLKFEDISYNIEAPIEKSKYYLQLRNEVFNS